MKKLLKNLICCVFILILNFAAFGQVVEHNTKIKDGSVSNSSVTPVANAILELESTKKGFLLPRMSSTQRDAIPIQDRENGNGLSIYNTDTNCLNYWVKSTSTWMSLCGTLPPAVITLDPATMCTKIVLRTIDKKDKLKQGQYLLPDDILYLDINVVTGGTYDISAISSNGYYFSGSGTFMNTGIVRVALKGAGVPITGYSLPTEGDTLSFYLNGKNLGNLCPTYKINVEKDTTQFTVDCATTYNGSGNYYIGIPVDPLTNFVEVKVNVTTIGNYRISTNVVNGVSFSAVGTFSAIGNNQIVKLYAEGTPISGGSNQLSIETNSDNNTVPACKINVTVKDVDYKVDLSKSKHNGEFVKGKKLTSSNNISIEVEVLAPGKASFELKSGAVIFSATNVVLNYKVGVINKQMVTLSNNGATLSEIDSKLTFTGTGKYSNTYSIDLITPPVNYILNCSTLKVNETVPYVPGQAVGNEHYLTVSVNVVTPGNYVMKTNVSNGVYFEANGTFDKVESAKIVKMKAVGTPILEKEKVQYIIETNSLSDSKNNCSIDLSISFPTRSFNIMVLGDEEYGPSYPSGGAYRLLMNPDYFGTNGLVKTKGINVTLYKERAVTTPVVARDFSTTLKNRNIDILLIVHGGAILSDVSKVALEQFIKDNGVIILSNHGDHFMAGVISELIEPSYTKGFSVYNNEGVITLKNDIGNLSSPFGSVAGKRIANFKPKYSYWSNFDSSYYETLIPALTSNSGDAFAVKHKTKSYMYIGHGGWMASTMGRNTIGALKATVDGRYEQTTFNGSRVDNALFFLKVMEWAITTSLDKKK